jgi:hypothetical protein
MRRRRLQKVWNYLVALALELRLNVVSSLKDRLGDQRGGGEWMGADKNSSRRRLKLRQDELAWSDPQNHTLRTSTFRLPKPRSH